MLLLMLLFGIYFPIVGKNMPNIPGLALGALRANSLELKGNALNALVLHGFCRRLVA
jgi:hypothetical protein